MDNYVQLGSINTLKILRKVSIGYYLDGGEWGDVLLPLRYVDQELKVDDTIEVMLYLDNEERPIATTEKPFAQVGDFAFLKVSSVGDFGAFIDWGLTKELFCPFGEQKQKLESGEKACFYLFIDERTNRITASTKLDKFTTQFFNYTEGQDVKILLWQKTDLGYKCIINNKNEGMVFHNEIFKPIQIGDLIDAKIKRIRPDMKIDLIIENTLDHEKPEVHSEKILKMLEEHNGFLPYNDDTKAEVIYDIFNISKKSFKKAIGMLYRSKEILITNDGIQKI